MSDSPIILIVDDNPDNLQVLGDILHGAGLSIRPALSGEIALHAIDAQLPDLILLDIRMPGMDGYAFCRQLKADLGKRDIPIIFISALNEMEDKLTAFRVGAVDYITKPFHAEEVLARVSTQVELAISKKTLAETNTRLVALMDQLVQSEKLKSLGSLAAGVAHELSTPVGNAILAASSIELMANEFAETRATDASEPGIDELLSTCRAGAELIQRNLNRASRLIGALKEIAVDQASERRRQVNLRETVADIVETMSGILARAHCSVLIRIAPDLVLETYPGHLEQILDNLLHNSIIHGFDGAPGGTITISARRDGDSRVLLIVDDDGNGIAAENLKRVFDPFFTTRLGQGGSGLGLHIVYNLATGILGGNISVASTPGAGAQFTLTLPLVAPLDAASVADDGPEQASD